MWLLDSTGDGALLHAALVASSSLRSRYKPSLAMVLTSVIE